MKFYLCLLFIIVCANVQAQDESCAKAKIEIIGSYGKDKSPLLKLWSEASGNLTEIKINSKQKMSKVELIFKDENKSSIHSQIFTLNKNRTESFDLIKLISQQKTRPKFLSVKIYNASGASVCSQEETLIERDGQDGVFKKL